MALYAFRYMQVPYYRAYSLASATSRRPATVSWAWTWAREPARAGVAPSTDEKDGSMTMSATSGGGTTGSSRVAPLVSCGAEMGRRREPMGAGETRCG